MSHIRPGDRLALRDAEQVEGRVLRVDRDGLLVDWGGQVGTHHHLWSDVGARFVRLPRAVAAEASGGGRAEIGRRPPPSQ